MSRRGIKVKSVRRLLGVTIPPQTRLKRLTRAGALLQRFPTWCVKKIAFQDEKDFTIEVPSNRQNNRIYIRGKKAEVHQSRLYHQANRQSVKLVVSCCLFTKVLLSLPKITGVYYTKHLERDLLPECAKLYPDDDYIFMQDGASSHTSKICQEKLKQLRG